MTQNGFLKDVRNYNHTCRAETYVHIQESQNRQRRIKDGGE